MGMVRSVPDGYRVEETDERLSSIGRRFFRSRAEKLAAYYTSVNDSYHLRIEPVSNVPFLYEVASYQNKLVKR